MSIGVLGRFVLGIREDRTQRNAGAVSPGMLSRETTCERSTQVASIVLPDPSRGVVITLSKCGSIYTVVDPECEELVRQYRWSLHVSNPRCSKKAYARAERCPVTGNKLRLYLHRFICEKVHGPPPSPEHIADHRDDNGLNNRGMNLRWRTKQANSWALAVGHARQSGLA